MVVTHYITQDTKFQLKNVMTSSLSQIRDPVGPIHFYPLAITFHNIQTEKTN